MGSLATLSVTSPSSLGVSPDDDQICWKGTSSSVSCRGPLLATPEIGTPGPPAAFGYVPGADHHCFLLDDGVAGNGSRVRCWGANASGQLGDGTTMARTSAVDVTGY